jgi:hypothetical protein
MDMQLGVFCTTPVKTPNELGTSLQSRETRIARLPNDRSEQYVTRQMKRFFCGSERGLDDVQLIEYCEESNICRHVLICEFKSFLPLKLFPDF